MRGRSRSREAMIAAFRDAIAAADRQRQRALLLAHPDLAGRAAIAGDLTARFAARAGRRRARPADAGGVRALHRAQRRAIARRFGIPFIFAVRGATKHDILEAFERRLGNPQEVEFATALEQVGRIVSFRLEDRVSA